MLTPSPARPLYFQFILRGYRAGHTFWSSLGSVFRLHNETGNIWTHLVGFIIFICLTVATLRLHPAPLRLGGEALGALEDRLVALEHRMTSLGSRTPSLFDLVAGGAAWERAARAAGAEGVALAEQALRSIRRHNLGEVTALADALKGGLARRAASAGAELAALEARLEARLAALGGDLSSFSAEAARDLESALHRGLASIFGGPGASWPAARWPMVVFTAGAMACLLTSCVCHVFGCCAAHVAAVMWRFDYAGIAVLIVASFFPPVYYGFLCRPALRAFYLLITSALGLWSV
jgi:adiponectin receptor